MRSGAVVGPPGRAAGGPTRAAARSGAAFVVEDIAPSTKLDRLRSGCQPTKTQVEREADAMAIGILTKLARHPPYRQPVFSERGSMYWAIDQIALAADAWDTATTERAAAAGKLHPSFDPPELPVPPAEVATNARRFVCDALTRRDGVVAFPVRPSTHPPMAERLRRVAEALEPIARELPATGGSEDFAPVARLQEGFGAITAFMHRARGAYLTSLYDQICTLVNGSDPLASCAPTR